MDLRELQKAYLDNLRQVTEEKLEIGSLIRTIILLTRVWYLRMEETEAKEVGYYRSR